PMQVYFLRLGVDWQLTKVSLEFGERTVDIDARILRVIAFPYRNRAAPVAVATDRPVSGTLKPLAKLPVLHILGHPVDLFVDLEHALFDFGHPHKPARHRLVDQWVAAAPAVRVAVLIA